LIGSTDKIYQPNTPGKDRVFDGVCFEEISNVPSLAADDAEKSSRITYQIFVYVQKNLQEVVNAVERVMTSISFVRHSAEPLRNLPAGVKGKKILFVTEREDD
jgi:hypothetical protein